MPNELFIYGDIGESWWEEGITDKDVIAALQELPDSDGLDIRINTFGGSVGEALAMMNSIRAYARKQLALNSQFKLRTVVDGFAYSAGTILMLSADDRIMNPGTKAMSHNPITFAYGNYKDFEKLAVEYRGHANYMAELFASATGKEMAEWQALMDEETYFTAAEAVKVGLATKEEKYEPLTKSSISSESNKQSSNGHSPQKASQRILVPSSVYEANKDTLSSVHTLGKGAYRKTLAIGRKERQKNIPISNPYPLDRLQRELDLDIIEVECK